MLSSYGGVGFALLRLEHITGVERGDLELEFETTDGEKCQVSPWRPDWWPQDASTTAEANT